MKEVCQKFKEKANIGHDTNIFYSYDGKIGLNEELTFEQTANSEDKKRNKMNILVYENQTEIIINNKIKSKNIICPECKENIKMDLKDYKINLYDCINGHRTDNILLNEFEETQMIEQDKIICEICQKNKKNNSYENKFFNCLTCTKNICSLCTLNHSKEHKIINYDEKYYICHKHNDKFISYCEECKINLCLLCNEHKVHKRILFTDIFPDKDNLMKRKEELKNNLERFIKEIDYFKKILVNILSDVSNKMNLYYKINEDIINNYCNNTNRNYETIYYLNQFLNNNINNDINSVVDCGAITDKFKNIFNLYSKMNINEITLIYNVKDQKNVELLSHSFVERYKNNCKLIINGKEQALQETYSFGIFSKSNQDYFEIKLKGITNIFNASKMFYYCYLLSSLPDIHRWNTSFINDMSYLFNTCGDGFISKEKSFLSIGICDSSEISINSFLKSLPDISKWDTSNVTDMSCMFKRCSLLKSLPDISKWDTSNVILMYEMFSHCSSLLSLPDISKWNFSNVINMIEKFSYCSPLSSLPNISKLKNSLKIDVDKIFLGCK